MGLRKILDDKDPALHKVCKPVESFDEKLHKLLDDMRETLIDSNGVWVDVDKVFLARRNAPYTQEYYEGVAHTIFPLAAVFTKEYCHIDDSERGNDGA